MTGIATALTAADAEHWGVAIGSAYEAWPDCKQLWDKVTVHPCVTAPAAACDIHGIVQATLARHQLASLPHCDGHAQIIIGNSETGGVPLVAVTPGGAAARAGLVAGDRIISLEGLATPTTRFFRAALREHGPGEYVRIGYQRAGVAHDAYVQLAAY